MEWLHRFWEFWLAKAEDMDTDDDDEWTDWPEDEP
jgi:hypothetical protein